MEPKKEADRAMPMTVALIADRLVRSEMMEAHVKRHEAESTVARRAGLSPFTLQNLKRGRLKNVEAIRSKIRAAFVAFLERQVVKAEAELAMARLLERDVDFSAVEAAIDAANRALGRVSR
jgi:hypothetical protein